MPLQVIEQVFQQKRRDSKMKFSFFNHHENSVSHAGTGYTVSVIIPCFNVQEYIDECLSSVCDQTLKELEIICVDDGSLDNTGNMLRQWHGRDKRVKVITQENRGVSAARNTGLKHASGEYVFFLDGDELLADSRVLANAAAAMKENRLDLLRGSAETRFVSEQLKEQYAGFENRYLIHHVYPEVLSGPDAIVALRRNNEWAVPPALCMYRRSFLEEHGIRFKEGIIHEDGLFMLQVFLLADRVRIIKDSLYIRRLRPDSIMTGEVTHKNVLGYLTVLSEEIRFLEKYSERFMWKEEIGRSAAVALKLAARKYCELSQEEKKLVQTEMTAEQRFWFSSFVMSEINAITNAARNESGK